MYSEINELMGGEEVSEYIYVLIDNNTNEVWGVYSSIGGAFEEFYSTVVRWYGDECSEYDMDINHGDVLIGRDLNREGIDFIIHRTELKK